MTTQQRPRTAVEEAIAFGLLTAVGGYAFVASFEYDLLNEGNRVGPGLLPAVVGALIAVISAVLLVLTLTGRRTRHDHGLAEVAASVTEDGTAEESAVSGDTDGDAGGREDVDIFGRTAAQRMRQLWMVTLALVAALFLVSIVGLLAALALFSLFCSIVVERRPWLPSVLITAASVAAVYGVFVVFLEVPLPTGTLGIGETG